MTVPLLVDDDVRIKGEYVCLAHQFRVLPKKELDEKDAEGLKTVLKRSMAKMLGGDEEKEERNEEKGEEASNEKSLDSIAKLFA